MRCAVCDQPIEQVRLSLTAIVHPPPRYHWITSPWICSPACLLQWLHDHEMLRDPFC